LLSEVMLQQTQVQRVIPAYHRFLSRFSTLGALASEPTADVLRAWEGMGYNRRALYLKRAALAVREEHGGSLPRTVEELARLPGIGRYTSRAVACFAFDVQVAVVDTNVRRLLSGLVGRPLTEKETETLAGLLLPVGRAADWNQALMDYGSLVERAKPRRLAIPRQRFAESDRFWRGRIVDALRLHDALPMALLLAALPEAGRDESRIRRLVRALHNEGLAAYDEAMDTVALPA
ncbi:MAG: A/G-specific adenine glycosylase, partial [Chloroflexota bacterium]|nr:A/G-specific adenine glycosylase [Chloroflexota bacterium]